MSGPKVVRIVTREEVLEICHGMLARVDAALEQWVRIGKRNDCIDEATIAEARTRREKLAEMIARDRFAELQKHAPLEEQFLRDDLQHRLVAIAAEQASQRSRQQRSKENAAAILAALRRSGLPFDSVLENALTLGKADAVAKAMDVLSSSNETEINRELAEGLKEEGARRGTLWNAGTAQSHPEIERIMTRIVEVRQLDPSAVDPAWEDRLAAVEAAPNDRRALILDALEVETGRRLDEVKRRAALLGELAAIYAEAHAAGLTIDAVQGEAEEITSQQIERRIDEIRGMINGHRKARASAEARSVLLKALGDLGYEVTEGMATATPVDGKLVLKSASRPDYGVEVSGADRLQLRPVAFTIGGTGPDVSRDRDAETIWCGDVSRLEQVLGEAGAELKIEKSTPVGAVALRRIAIASAGRDDRREAPGPQQRSLPS